MSAGIDQGTLIVLAMDFDQCTSELLQHLHTHRLVVDKRTGSTVGELYAAEDQLIFGWNVVGGEQRARRVVARDIEHGGNLALLDSLPDQRLIPATTQGQSKSIEQDRFAGARFAGEDSEPVGEIDIEVVDQHDVADRESGEHGAFTVLAVVRSGIAPGIHALQILHNQRRRRSGQARPRSCG
jgi:hypothetical protein